MFQHSVLRWIAALGVPLLATLPAAAAEIFEIGSHGVTITLDESWQRQRLSPDLGPDQFVSRKGLFTQIVEFEGMFEDRHDLESMLERLVSASRVHHKIVEEDPRVWFEDDRSVLRATRRFRAQYGGLELAFQLDLVARDGLGYYLVAWGQASGAVDVHDWASRTARSLAFPGDESEWGRRAAPSAHRVRFDGWTVEMRWSVASSANSGLPRSGWRQRPRGRCFWSVRTSRSRCSGSRAGER